MVITTRLLFVFMLCSYECADKTHLIVLLTKLSVVSYSCLSHLYDIPYHLVVSVRCAHLKRVHFPFYKI